MTTTDAILAAASRWVGVPYGPVHGRFDATLINCSTLTARSCEVVYYPQGMPAAAWLDIEIGDPDGSGPLAATPWSSIDRAIRDGWGEALPDGAELPVWVGVYLAQCWHELLRRGHAVLVFVVVEADGVWCYVLEATNAGPGSGYGVHWRGTTHPATAPLRVQDGHRMRLEDFAAEYAAGVRFARLREIG